MYVCIYIYIYKYIIHGLGGYEGLLVPGQDGRLGPLQAGVDEA